MHNGSNLKAIAKGNNLGIRFYHIAGELEPNVQIRTTKIASLLSENNYELRVLAGYMKKLDGSFIDSFKGKIVNIHPSLLPKYGGKGIYGSKVCRGVLKKQGISPRG